MVILKMFLDVLPEKKEELLQTIKALLNIIRKENGFLDYHLMMDMEDENLFHLVEEWKAWKDLNRHLKSDQFRVLYGADHLLSSKMKVEIDEISNRTGMETYQKIQAKGLEY